MAAKAGMKGKKSSSQTSKSTSSSTTRSRKKSSTSSTSNKIIRRAPAKQQKTKPGSHNPTSTVAASSRHRKHRVYTDAELNLPALNTITPASAAAAPRGSGKKKNKIYVDDPESMLTIMALVNAEKKDQIGSKMVKMRQMEQIREARQRETEKRKTERRERLEGVKKGLRKGRGKLYGGDDDRDGRAQVVRRNRNDGKTVGIKNVSFA